MSHIPIKWAERDDRLFITVEAINATDVEVKFAEKSISISGTGITARDSQPHALKDELSLFKAIKPEESSFKVLGVSIQICAIKADKGYWERLVDQPTKETKGWLSVDWNLWKDEDDVEEPGNGMADNFGGYGDLSSMMGGMGGMMGGMGGMGGMMGGMGGMGGMDFGGMDMGAMGDMPDSDDEDEGEGEEQKEGTEAADLKDLDA